MKGAMNGEPHNTLAAMQFQGPGTLRSFPDAMQISDQRLQRTLSREFHKWRKLNYRLSGFSLARKLGFAGERGGNSDPL